MKKLFAFVLLSLIAAFSAFAKVPAEGYWVYYLEDYNLIPFAFNFYQAENEKLEAVLIFSPGIDESALAVECKDLRPIKNFPISGDFEKMKILYETPWIFNLEKKSEGVWGNGVYIAPDEGKKYDCKLTFKSADGKKYKTDSLVVTISIGLVGQDIVLVRPTQDMMGGLKLQVKAFTTFIEMVEK
ncbi:MAG: DUF2147 domain-containing protein [Treponema sp.]|nr:DUF2147 domain-containing protein [Treponema sp.]